MDRPGPFPAPRRFALARALTEVAARAGAERALVLYSAVGIVATVLFAGNGIRAGDVTRTAASSPVFRFALVITWVTAATPLAGAVLVLPSTFVLRALPIARRRFLAISAAHLLVAELPWAILWFRGAGLVAGLSATAIAFAAHCLVVARAQGGWERLAFASLVACVALDARLAWSAAVALPIALFALRAAFLRAPEHPAAITIGGAVPPSWASASPSTALARAHLALLRRAEKSLLLRAVALLLVSAGGAALAARNNEVTDPARLLALSLALAAAALSPATAAIAGAVLRTERAERWLLEVTATSSRARVASSVIATGLCGATLGALHAAAVLSIAGDHRVNVVASLLGGSVLLGGAIGALAARAIRSSETAAGFGGWGALVRVGALAAIAATLCALAGALALFPLVAAAVAATLSRSAARPLALEARP